MTIPSPQSIGIDHEEWRSFQPEAINYALDLAKMNDTQYMLLEAPTGTGKTAVACAIGALMESCWTGVTITTDLQTQYAEGYGIPTVMGKGRYPCLREEWQYKYRQLEGFQSKNGVDEPTAENCMMLIEGKKMSECSTPCAYLQAKGEAMNAGHSVLNLHYAYLTNWWRPASKLVVFDECHRLPLTLADLNEQQYTDEQRKRYKWPEFPTENGSGVKARASFATWLDMVALIDWDYAMQQAGGDLQNRAIRLHRARARRQRTVELAERVRFSDEYYIHVNVNKKNYQVEGINLRSVDVVPAFKRLMENADPKLVLLMSATIGAPEPLARRLGLPMDRTWFHSIPATFPPENRKVYLWSQAPKINYRTTDKEWDRIADKCREIINIHKGERGLIHTSSWWQAKMLKDKIGSYRCYIPEGPRSQAIADFRDSDFDSVAIAPSWKEGINLPDDECRFGIGVKVPFGPWDDPVTQIRTKTKEGKVEYDYNAALDLVQAQGRMVRHERDYGTFYILDANWKRVAQYAPDWFEVEIWT